MNRILFHLLLASALLILRFGSNAAAETPKYVAVAGYPNTPEMNETVGKRTHAILRARGIQSVAAGSAGMTVSVPADRVAEARQLLAKAVKKEGLKLTLFVIPP